MSLFLLSEFVARARAGEREHEIAEDILEHAEDVEETSVAVEVQEAEAAEIEAQAATDDPAG